MPEEIKKKKKELNLLLIDINALRNKQYLNSIVSIFDLRTQSTFVIAGTYGCRWRRCVRTCPFRPGNSAVLIGAHDVSGGRKVLVYPCRSRYRLSLTQLMPATSSHHAPLSKYQARIIKVSGTSTMAILVAHASSFYRSWLSSCCFHQHHVFLFTL